MNADNVTNVRWETADGREVEGQLWPHDEAAASVVLIHGAGDHIGRFEWLARQLNVSGYQVIGADWQGNGQSPGTRGYVESFELVCDEIDRMIRAARERSSSPLFLYGQSLGGLLALYRMMQGKKPAVAGVIASSPALGLAIDPPAWKLLVGRTLGKPFPKMNLPTGIQVDELTRDEAAQEAFRNDRLRHGRICARTFFSMLDLATWVNTNPERLNTPTLVMHGESDTVTDCEASKRFSESAFDDCQFKPWPELRHELHQEIGKQEVVEYVIRWIESQLTAN